MIQQIVKKNVRDLIPYINNAKQHSEKQISQVAASIKEFGFNNPILIDGENGIIAGHCRLLAAQKLKMQDVPTIEIKHLSPTQKKAFILADNKLNESSWDDDILNLELTDLFVDGFDLSLAGFDDFKINIEDPGDDDNEIDEIPIPELPIVKLGDIWSLGKHRLMCGDSTTAEDTEKLLTARPDLIFTDPPYGINIQKNTGTVGGGKISTPKPYVKFQDDNSTDAAKLFYFQCMYQGFENIVIWGGNYFTNFLPPTSSWLIWNKEMTGRDFSQAEMAWTSIKKGGVQIFKHTWNGMVRDGNLTDEMKTRVHPTQKPVGLFVDIFEKINGNIVYDGFLGSGSTLIACEKMGRRCFGMEIEPHYCDVIIERWQNYTGETAQKVAA